MQAQESRSDGRTAHAAGKSHLVQDIENIIYAPAFIVIPETVFDADTFGAKGDGQSICTEAIQRAIDAAHQAGGGIVRFKPGTYRSGALFVKSNVELRLDEGVVLQAVQDDALYPRLPTRIAGVEMDWPAAFINVYEQQNVRIAGKGVIDGNGEYWWRKFNDMRNGYRERKLRFAVDYDCERVRAVVVWKSSNVQLKDFTIQRSGFWTVTTTYSDRVHVDGVVVRNNLGGHGPSSDGINTDSSSWVLVENCDIDCNDDNLCLKSGKDADGLRVNRPVENVVYRHCVTRAGYGMFTIGSETSGGMRNVEVYGLKAQGTVAGIRFKSARVRGGVMENIYFHDIGMDGVKVAFPFDMDWYPEYSNARIPPGIPESEITDRWRLLTQPVVPPERGIPEFRDIRFRDITVRASETAISAKACGEKPFRHFDWSNVAFEVKSAGEIEHAADWTMEGVTLKTADGKGFELRNCVNVEDPPPVNGNRNNMTTGNKNEMAPPDEFVIGRDEFGPIVRVNVEKLRDLLRVPGIKAVYPTDADPEQPNRHHAVISNMKDLNGDGNIHVFRALIDKPYTRLACYDQTGRRVWISDKIAAGGDDESGMPIVDLDGDGRYEILLSQWASLYCLDAHTGKIKWQRDLDKGGKEGPGNWDCPMVVGHFIARDRLHVVARSGLNLRCFDGQGQDVWHVPLTGETYGHCLCRFDADGDGLDEIYSSRNRMIDAVSGNGTVLWRDPTQGSHSDNFAFGDLDGDGRCEVVYDHDGCGGQGPLYVADAVTGILKYTIDYRRHGLEHCQGFVMDKFCPGRPGLQIAAVGKDHRLLLFDCTGGLIWERRTYTGLVTRADWNGDGVPEILVFAVGTDLDPAWSVWNGKGERLFAMSFLPAPQRCHASQCGPGLGFDGFTDLDGNGKADILVAYGRWKTGDPQYHFIAEAPDGRT